MLDKAHRPDPSSSLVAKSKKPKLKTALNNSVSGYALDDEDGIRAAYADKDSRQEYHAKGTDALRFVLAEVGSFFLRLACRPVSDGAGDAL
jgi:hypothetical protein